MLSIGNYLQTGGIYRKRISGLSGVVIYTDGQKKRCSKSLTCIACDSQARAAQAYHDQNLEPSIWFILICQLCLPGMLAIYMYTFYLLSLYFILLSNLSQILDVALFIPVSIYLCVKWGNGIFRYDYSNKFIASTNFADESYVPSVITCH